MPSPQLQPLLELLHTRPAPPLESVAALRDEMSIMGAWFNLPDEASCESVDAGGVAAEWLWLAPVEPHPVVVYLHGGGYVLGSPKTHRELALRVARAAGARVLSIDYRLAPEHPHPAAVDDALAAYRWLLAAGVAPERVVLMGDSAGGGLVVATLVALAASGARLPAAGVCLSPWVDLTIEGASAQQSRPGDPLISPELLRTMAAHYLADLPAWTPLASPLFAPLAGLPPLLIQVGTAELLYDDAARLAARACAAGVDVQFEPWDDMPHVWHLFAASLPEGRAAIEQVGRYVRERTGTTSP